MSNNYKFFHTSGSSGLASQISDDLNMSTGVMFTDKFSDGEVFTRYEESIRGHKLFILGQSDMPYEKLFELFLAIDAARRASAKEIVCIIPYLPHSRQERKDADRTSIAARVVADFLQQVGADRVMTVDLHSNSIEGFFKIPVDHIDVSRLFARHLRSRNLDNLCLCSPDFGGLKRIKKYKQLIETEMAVIHKERLKPNQVANMEIIGDVSGKNVVIIDDMIDTAGTLCKAAEQLIENGALSVDAYCTHGLLSGPAKQRITDSPLQNVYITDTVVQGDLPDKIKVLSCSEVIAKAMTNLMQNKSIKELNEQSIES